MAAFEVEADRRIVRLSRALRSGAYVARPYRLKVIFDPKKRLICTPSLEDRIVQKALIQEIGPTYERGFHPWSFASGRGRGPHRAVLRALACNRKFAFRWHLDVHRYFLSVHRPTLLALIARRLRDSETVSLVEAQLSEGGRVYETPLAVQALNLADKPRPSADSGIAIGSYLSQWSGALYLDGLDHYATRTLKVSGYQRYMDDLLLFADDRAPLREAREQIEDWLRNERWLVLNRRTAIESTKAPFEYLGYRISRGGIDATRKLQRRMKQKLRAAADRSPDALERCEDSYRGLLLFGAGSTRK